MSNDIEQLISLIGNILQPNDKALRQNSQRTLVELRTTKPNQLMMGFLAILGGDYLLEHRNFSATQLRLCLSTFAPATYKNVWKDLTPQNQNMIKSRLFAILYAEPSDTMKKHIADTLGQIAGSVKSQNGQQWPQFKIHLWQLFKQNGFQSIMAGFFLLQTFLPYSPQTFKDDQNDLYVLFRNGLVHQNNKIKVSSLNAFSSFLQILEIKQQKKFKPLIMDIFNAVYSLLVNDNFNDEGLQVLSQMLDVQYKFFKQNFKQLNQLLQNVFKINNIQSGIKRMATQILVDFSQKSPALFRKNKQYLTGIIQMIFFHMVDIQSDVSDEWKCPPQGYNDNMDDDEDYQTTRFGMNSIDRLIYSVGDKQVLPILSQAIKGLLSQSGWKYQYTAVMALSQIGQYMEDVTHISSIIEMIANYFGSDNAMLRYASCHAIGQISDDMQPKFQQTYGDLLYPKIVNLLKDSIPRVVSHAAACLTNFLQGMKYEKVSQYLDQLMQMLIYHSTNGISLVKQSCLSTISSVAELVKSDFQKYLQKTVQLLFNIIDTHTKKQYKQLRGQSIQTLTIIASSIGGDKFRPALDKLVNIMISIQESTFEQTDPQKSYILSGWQRLCLVYGKQLSIYLNRILPSLFALVQNVISTELQKVTHHEPLNEQKQQKDKQKKESINTFETQEAEVAIAMLNVFIEKLKQLYSPYVQSTVTLLCKIITDHINDSVRDEACKCLPSLVSAVKVSNVQTAIEMTKYFMQTLIKTIESQSDPEFICIQLETLKSVIEDLDLSFLNQSQISVFTQKILKILSDSEQSKNVTQKYKRTQQQLDQQDKQLFDQQIKQQQEVQVAVSQVIGKLFKTHKDITLPLANYLITSILPNILKPGQSENAYKLGIFMIDDMVQYLGYDRLQSNWFYFSTVLVNFTRQKNCQIRQAACYGLGILAQRTPSSVSTSQIIDGWLQQLINASKIGKGNEKQKTFGHCRDNAIASIGKILKSHGQRVNVSDYLKYWITFLPLRFDKPEAIIQHGLLIDILMNKPQFILGTGEHDQIAGLHKVLSIYGTILNNQKIYNQQVKIKMKTHILSLQSNSIFMNNRQKIWTHLSEKERHNITQLLK